MVYHIYPNIETISLTLLHSKWPPKLYGVLTVLNAIGLTGPVALDRVRTEIGYQNSRTFPGLFKDYLYFFQESFFINSNSPNNAYTQDFCSIQDRKRISHSRSLFLPDFNSSYHLRTLLSFLPFPISAL